MKILSFIPLVFSDLLYIDNTQPLWYTTPAELMLNQNRVPFDIEKFSRHGCWCSKHKGGKTMSPLDNLCHQLSQCLKCVDIEKGCSEATNQWIADINAGQLSCSKNLNPCMRMKCECAQDVLMKIVSKLSIDHRIEDLECPVQEIKKENFKKIEVQLSRPTINLKSALGFDKSLKTVNDACCGHHPHWFPYSTHDGSRSCCGLKTYNNGNLKCCGNQTTVSVLAECPAAIPTLPPTLPPPAKYPTCKSNEVLSKTLNPEEFVCDDKIPCASTKTCAPVHDSDLRCDASARLVSYSIDDCCNYYYCAPFFNEKACVNVTCDSKPKICGRYQTSTVSLGTFAECCPQYECQCRYDSCPLKPDCGDKVLVNSLSEDKCCYEYECLDKI